MQRGTCTFSLQSSHITKLLKKGCDTASDVLDIKPAELYQEIGVTLEEAVQIHQTVKEETNKCHLNKNQTAFDLLQKHNDGTPQHIVSFCEKLDTMLGGGMPIGHVTECSGVPGSGKTQLCMQLAVAVQVPEIIGGLQGEAIYIDTEGSFTVERLTEMAAAAAQHCQSICEEQLHEFTPESVLQNITYFRCRDHYELMALTYTLPQFLVEHSNVRFIAVDSIAYHFRHSFDDFSQRNRLLSHIAQAFLRMAVEHRIAVVFTNHMTTKIDADGARLVPALGETWGHLPTNRIILSVCGNEHRAYLFKSASLPDAFARFQILKDGIRDVSV